MDKSNNNTDKRHWDGKKSRTSSDGRLVYSNDITTGPFAKDMNHNDDDDSTPIKKKKKAGWCSKLTYGATFIVSITCWFIEFPIGTQWNTIYEDKFKYPHLLFCPSIWLDETKARSQYNLSNETILYIYGFLIGSEVSIHGSLYVANVQQKRQTIKEELSNMSKHLNFQHPFLPKIMLALAYDSNEIFEYEEGMLDQMLDDGSVRESVVDTNYGVCYYRKVPEYPKTSLPATHLLQMTIKFPKREQPVITGTPLIRAILGYPMGDKLPIGGFIMSRNMIYQAKSERIHKVQIKTKSNPCNDHNGKTSLTSCHHDCYNEVLYLPCFGCSRPSGLNISLDEICNNFEMLDPTSGKQPTDLNPPNSTKCSKPTIQDIQNMSNEMKMCIDECPHEPCDSWVVSTIVESTPLEVRSLENDGYTSQLRLIQNNKYAHLEMREVWTYTWHTFISNIGGQMGLWLGMSLFSCLQLIESSLFNLCNYWKQKSQCNRLKKVEERSETSNGKAPMVESENCSSPDQTVNLLLKSPGKRETYV